MASSSASASSKPQSTSDAAWDHCFLPDPNATTKVQCKYCSKLVSGVNRFKWHIAGIPKQVTACDKVPPEVRKKYYDIITTKAQKKKKKDEELCRMRAGVGLTFSEGEGVDLDESAQVRNLGKQKQSIGGGPLDGIFKLSPEEARERGARELLLPKYSAKLKEANRDNACEYIAQWFYEASIPHNTVTLPSFNLMLEAIGICNRGLKGPTMYELSGPLLQKRKKKVEEGLAKHKETWELTGCSIMTDAWTDKKGRGIMNLMVHSAPGVVFLKSVDASSDKKDGLYIFQLIDKCIEEVGAKNVVQVVTDTARPNQTMGTLLRAKRPSIYWTGCAAHCIDLMLEDIGSLTKVRNTIQRAKTITVFLYAHTRVLSLMRVYLGKDLVRAGVTRFATAYLNLKSIQDKKSEIRKLFRSDELDSWGYLKHVKGKKAVKIVRQDAFWKGVDEAVNMFEPLAEMLRRVDGDVPAMGFLYGGLEEAKQEIVVRFGEDERQYKAVWEIVDKRWDDKMKTPLHLAGYFLNPYYYYANRFEIEKKGIFRENVLTCMERLLKEDEDALTILEKIMLELCHYQNSEGSFDRPLAKRQASNKNLNPAQWWVNHGGSSPNLKRLAVRILSLTCSSSGCERNWSTFDQVHTKKRARLLHHRLNDLVFVKFNSKLLQRKNDVDRDPIEIKNIDVMEDPNNEWIRNSEAMRHGEAPQQPVNEAMSVGEADNLQIIASASSLPKKKKRKISQTEEEEEFVSSSSNEDDEQIELDDASSSASESQSIESAE